MSKTAAPPIVDPLALSRLIQERYRNLCLDRVNDHELRLSVMTEQFPWHRHPDSDETFIGVEGDLVVEFLEGRVTLEPGQFVTVPAGTLHRTRPLHERSVNLTIERAGATTEFNDEKSSPRA